MDDWADVAERIADAFDLRPGALVVLRDRCGRTAVVDAVVVAFERRGVSTVIDPASDAVLDALLSGTDPELLSTWGRRRAAILELADAVVSLGAGPIPAGRASREALAALRAGRAAMQEVETRRSLPVVVVAVPTPLLADELGRSLAELDRVVRRALAPAIEGTRGLIATHVARAASDPLTLMTRGCSLVMQRGSRPWLADDGHISTADVARGAVVSNLPCGSIYTTVVEDSAEGTLRVPALADGRDVVLSFVSGVVAAAAGPGAETVLPWLAGFGPDAGRISHIGIGLNPACPGGTGWPIVDEHRAGAVFFAFGENRYLGGMNASALNHDVVLESASLLAGPTILVSGGRLVG